jgi:hypothetical protein
MKEKDPEGSKSVSGFQRPRITINSLTLDVIHILFCRSSLIFRFFFFIALLWHTHFILDVTFSSDLGMPPSI